METLLSILIACFLIWLLITLLPVILAVILIIVGVVIIYGIYVRHKLKKSMEETDTTTAFYSSGSSLSDNDDIIDVEFTESDGEDD